MASLDRRTSGRGASPLTIALGLLCFVLTLRCVLVQAVDIDGYHSNTACRGAGKSCRHARRNACCAFNGLLPRAVRIGVLNVGEFGVIYQGNAHESCGRAIASHHGPGRECLLGHGSVYGAEWFSVVASDGLSKSAEADEVSVDGGMKVGNQSVPACTSRMMPNAVVYTSDSSLGKWVLESHADTHDALLWELEAVEEKKKEEWLQSKGAYYAQDEGGNLSVL